MDKYEQVTSFIKGIRNSEYITNSFIMPNELAKLLESDNCSICSDDELMVISVDEAFRRIYFHAKNTDALEKLSDMDAFVTDKPIVLDILGREAQCKKISDKLLDNKFDLYSVFQRMNCSSAPVIGESAEYISVADPSAADAVADIILSNFDALNSYVPPREEIMNAVYKKEVLLYIKDGIHGLAYFEDTGSAFKTLRYIFIDKECRNQGVGQQFFNYEFSRNNPAKKYVLWVDTKNSGAMHLYEKNGFKQDGLFDYTIIYKGEA